MVRYIGLFSFLIGAALASSAFAQDIRHGSPERGQAIAEIWCSSCHLVTDSEQGTVLVDVPTFKNIARRLPNDTNFLIAFLANPHPPMPDLNLSRQDISDLLAYVATLK